MKIMLYYIIRKIVKLIVKIFSIPSRVLRLALQAKRSDYSFFEKIQIFRFLLINYINREFIRINRGEVSQRMFDFKVFAYDYPTLNYLFNEIFLSYEYYFNSLNSNPKIIDCGANIGMAILYFKKLYPESSVIAFEPNPYAFRMLEKNVIHNNLTNIQLFNTALSDINGEMEFFMGDNKGTLIGSFISERGGENKIIVKTQKLSEIINNEKFDLIKIDVEGAEIQVIEDLVAEGKIKQFNRFLIEYHHRIDGANSNMSNFIKPFEINNYQYNIRTHYKELGGFQDVFIDFYRDEDVANNPISTIG